MSSDEYKPYLPDIPSLEVPSTASMVPPVSLLFEDLEIAPKNSHNISGPSFQTFHSWNKNPLALQGNSHGIVSQNPAILKDIPQAPNIFNSNYRNKDLKREPVNTEKLIREVVEALKYAAESIVKSAVEDLQHEISQMLGNMQKTMASKPKTCYASTNTEITKTLDKEMECSYSVLDIGTQTEELVPNILTHDRRPYDMDSESEECIADMVEPIRNRKQECRRVALNHVGYDVDRGREVVHAFAPTTNLHGKGYTGAMVRPTPRREVLMPAVANNFSPNVFRQAGDVTMSAESLLHRYLPPEDLPGCKCCTKGNAEGQCQQYAVLNMTNVSFAMGYPSERKRTPVREEERRLPYGTPYGHKQHHSPDFHDEPRGFRHVDPIEPGGFRHENYMGRPRNRILDLSEIRRQPNLL